MRCRARPCLLPLEIVIIRNWYILKKHCGVSNTAVMAIVNDATMKSEIAARRLEFAMTILCCVHSAEQLESWGFIIPIMEKKSRRAEMNQV